MHRACQRVAAIREKLCITQITSLVEELKLPWPDADFVFENVYVKKGGEHLCKTENLIFSAIYFQNQFSIEYKFGCSYNVFSSFFELFLDIRT